MKKKLLLAGIVLLGIILALLFSSRVNAPNGTKKTADTPATTPGSSQPAGFNKKMYSTSDPTSPWVIINKQRALPTGYVPPDLTMVGGEQLRAEAATSLNNLLAAATAAGNPMAPLSGYRSYATQVSTYNGYVAKDGQAVADTYSARPGHSEHQTGWAMDLGNGFCDLEVCFADTPAGQWLAAHAHEYGFIIRYLKGKEAITGYQYEPWHLRYVGSDLARELHKTGQTMEEFFN